MHLNRRLVVGGGVLRIDNSHRRIEPADRVHGNANDVESPRDELHAVSGEDTRVIVQHPRKQRSSQDLVKHSK